ncbi:MAG: hypothetical protein V1745_01395 [Patescibacteria group bacterium]
MNTKRSIISRMILLFLVFATLGGALYVGSMLLEPVMVPEPFVTKPKVAFDASVDVSTNTVFKGLRPLGPATIEAGETGRLNPFAPLPPVSTSTPATAPTTTEPVPEATIEDVSVEVIPIDATSTEPVATETPITP